MNFSRTGAIVLALTVSPLCPSSFAQAPATLHLIPVPRELRAVATQSLSAGVQISCVAPCAPEDAFAIEDLKADLLARNIAVNGSSPVNILVTRYGSPNSRAIYSDSLRTPNIAEAMPEAMKPEGYVIIPDGRGLAITAASASGIFYALQTVKQLIDTPAGSASPVLHTATIRDWPAQNGARSSRFKILPEPVRGSSSRKVIVRGTL